MNNCKCQLPEGVSMRLGPLELEMDPCVYQLQEVHKNVTVYVSRCKNCGHVDISWERQEDTIDVEEDYQAMDDLID